MEEDLLKRRLLSNYCLFFLKEDLKEHIYYLRLKKKERIKNENGNRKNKFRRI